MLHALRVKGFADTDAVARTSGLDTGAVLDALEKLRADELARHRDGRVSGWALTSAGRAEHRRLADEELGVIQFEDWVDTGEEYEQLDEVAKDRAAAAAAV